MSEKKATIISLIITAIFVVGLGYGIVTNLPKPVSDRPKEISVVDVTTDDPHYSAKLSIVTVGECQYVLWHHGYGSDMEHYGACKGCSK